MNQFVWSDFLTVVGVSLLSIVALLAITAVVGFRIGRHNVVDVTWGLGFVVVAVAAALSGTGDGWRRILFVVLVGVWGLRLASSMFRRSRGKGEDPRYEEMLGRAGGHPVWTAVRKIYLTQALALWFVSLPLQVSAVTHGSFGIVSALGVALWLVGLTFETVGDAQMDKYKADKAQLPKDQQPTVMDRGLWAWTRHPNYFGDACVWWGIFLVAAAHWPGVLTAASPVAMTYFLVFATGAKLLERSMEKRPGYREYQQRTSYFIPRPPKRSAHQ
ncbi:DUF1295 domain-containing protein [Actinomycetes bacterium M1A6_2h]